MSTSALRGVRARAACACLVLVAIAAPTHAGIEVPPIPSLPDEPDAPYLWFDGDDQGDLARLRTRMTHPRTSAMYTALKAFVDARLTSMDDQDDDARSKIVKAAGLLHVLGVTPPDASPYASYRAAAVEAFLGVGERQAIDSFGELIVAPANAVNILQDASRLQSLAEGYDFLRGAAGTRDDEDEAMRDLLANWADAIARDWNLAGSSGVPGHRDNWGIKGGAALVTVALALPDHADAEGWLDAGMTYLNESLDVVASETGWYGESVWYLSYALANLWPTAWHVRNATSRNWFPALRPFVDASLAWRQPDGSAPPFEEGIANTLPWNVLATAYPELAPTILWAWEHSPKNVENFDNQHMHDVTRFLLIDLSTVAATAPGGSVTRFLPDDAHLVALRSSWGDDAIQATMLTARDYSTSELNATRHNMRNPLDMVLHGRGALVMPTASGGPQVTSSANRNTYLSVLAKNIPLVGRQAPFVVGASDVDLDARLDSEDVGQRPNHYADLARTTLTNVYADAREVSRLVALVDRSYVVVFDRFEAAAARAFELSWRGRGARTTRSDSGALQAFSWAGPSASAPRFDLDVVGSAPLVGVANASLYAPAWNQEEAVDGVIVGSNAAAASFVTVMQIVPDNEAGRSVTSVGDAEVAAASVVRGEVRDTALHRRESGRSSVDGIETDAEVALVRRSAGVLTSAALVRGTVLEVGAGRVETSGRATFAFTIGGGAFVAEISRDQNGDFELELDDVSGLDYAQPHVATLDGDPLELDQDGDRLRVFEVDEGTLVITEADCFAGAGADPDGDFYCGAGDNCPTIANPDQDDGDGDGTGDACECLDAGTRCDDDNACTNDQCDDTTGACAHTPRAGGCNDEDVCTEDDSCRDGACSGTPRVCSDGNTCTTDACNPVAGCVFNARIGPCDDGDACTAGDTCSGTTCAGAAVVCDDGDPCTLDLCDAASGCVTTPLDARACDDLDRCTRDDACADGVCVGPALDCDDGNPCSDDRCDPIAGCAHTDGPDGEGCDDGNACTTGDVCTAGECHGAGLQCDDGDPCTIDGCALGVGCTTRAAEPDAPCDDQDACTDADRCQAGVCAGDAVSCDDGDGCTIDFCDGDGSCVAQARACPDDQVCEDGECRVPEADPGPEPEPEADPEVAAETTPEPDKDLADLAEPPPEAGDELGPDAADGDIVEPDAVDPSDADPEIDPSDPDAASRDAEGLSFVDTGSQRIGESDDGCGAGGTPALVLGALALLVAQRRRRAP